ncbi:mechanosensitive ion channel domain-containing protein [Kaarinaea lacus]
MSTNAVAFSRQVQKSEFPVMRKLALFLTSSLFKSSAHCASSETRTWMLRTLLMFVLFLASSWGYASEIDDLQKQLTQIESEYPLRDITVHSANKALKDIVMLKGKVDAQTDKQQLLVSEIKQQLDSLGEMNSAEPKMVQDKRIALKGELQKNEALLSRFKVLSIAVTERHKEYQDKSQTLFKERLLNRGPTIVELIPKAIAADALMVDVLSKFIVQRHGLDLLTQNDYIVLVVWVLLAGVGSYWVRKKLKTWSLARRWGNAPFDIFSQSLIITIVRYLPRLIITIVLAGFIWQLQSTFASTSFIQIVFLSLPIYFLARLVVEMVLFPRLPARRVIQLNDDVARLLSRWFRVFVNVLFIGAIIFWAIRSAEPPELTVLLTRDAFMIVCVPLVITLLFISGKIRDWERFRLLRMVLFFLLVVTLVFELLGFRNFSYFVLRSLFSLTFLYGSLRAIQWIFNQLVSVLENDNYKISRAIKKTLGLKTKQHIPGLIAFNFFVHVSLWVVFFFVIIRALGFSEEIVVTIQNWFLSGFTLGNLTINPVRILLAIVLFSSLYVASGWFKSSIEKKWLLKADIDSGARETIVTIIGYLGVTIALLVGLSVAGVTFTNLAIIAGALSVGIGFGLQNIVNNFVSGLILLFERPIKKGDWIVVGNTEGYVKKISIRSTQIQTFDRSDVIVPNSDLISSQVTNWMLYDRSGRLRLPIGVAYGSDTEKVKNLLLDLADSHDAVIKNDSEYPIRALFLGFGDSSLNFELRCHIKNIDERLSVLSDMNYKLDAMFRENNIEIPFPQRDIHIRSGSAQVLKPED